MILLASKVSKSFLAKARLSAASWRGCAGTEVLLVTARFATRSVIESTPSDDLVKRWEFYKQWLRIIWEIMKYGAGSVFVCEGFETQTSNFRQETNQVQPT